MRVLVQPIWQQKHPTPSHAGWDYHWHPRGIDRTVTGALAALDLALAGGAQSGWVVTPGALAWVRTFSAEVPSEQRRYVGLAGIAARPAPGAEADWPEALPGLLATVPLPPAAPFASGAGGARPPEPSGRQGLRDGQAAGDALAAGDEPRALDVPRLAAAPIGLAGIPPEPLARALLFGGRAAVPAPDQAGIAGLVGRALAWLPPEARVRERSVAFGAEPRPAPARAAADEHVIHYLARALAATGAEAAFACAAWGLLREACATSRRTLLATFAALAELAGAWDGAGDLAAYLAHGVLSRDEIARCDARAPAPLMADDGDAGMLWNRVLHYWGRGLLAGAGLEARLARVLAGRILVDHLIRLDGRAGADPLRYARRMRYEALLPAPRAAALARALSAELPGLQGSA